jgi:hypothetical protein
MMMKSRKMLGLKIINIFSIFCFPSSISLNFLFYISCDFKWDEELPQRILVEIWLIPSIIPNHFHFHYPIMNLHSYDFLLYIYIICILKTSIMMEIFPICSHYTANFNWTLFFINIFSWFVRELTTLDSH